MKDYILNIKGRSEVVVCDNFQALHARLPKARTFVITDQTIASLYAAELEAFECIIIGEGEENKTLATMEYIYSQLIERGADRKCFLLGIGGGIVTDVTGFVAATYLRGVDFAFMSTTLLSQVDAGVGGKNGVNLGGYKNMVGTFNQPRFVICNIGMLKTLNERELRAGMAEVIKAAIIADPALFAMLEGCSLQEVLSNEDLLSRAVIASVEVKAAIVERDEREAGERRKLNLGHTFAHAIEKLSREMIHGEAVAVGTIIATRISRNLGLISADDQERIANIHRNMGFNLLPPLSEDQLLSVIMKDKKAEGQQIFMVLPRTIGDCEVRGMSYEEVAQSL